MMPNGKAMMLKSQGGTYDWESMTLCPDDDGEMTEVNYQAIGKLTSDAGISVYMGYTDDESGAFSFDVANAFMSTWGYGHAVFFDARNINQEVGSSARDAAFQKSMFANFDAGYPVVMGIPGHEIVADGYGYESGYDYIHLNMGWAGSYDFWYNLPDITEAGFYGMDDVTYNVFPSGGKTTAIISGRALGEARDDGTFEPMPNATIRLYRQGASTEEPTAEVVSQESGVWGVKVLAGTYDIYAVSEDGKKSAEMLGVKVSAPMPQDVNYNNLGRPAPTVQGVSGLGNSWGNDIRLVIPPVRVGTQSFYDLDHALAYAATNADSTVEVLFEAELRQPFTITNSCTIVATNDNPWASLVIPRSGATLTIANDARVLFKNIAFSPTATALVNVENGATAAIDGAVGISRIRTAHFTGFEVAGVTTNVFEIDCADAKTAGEFFGWASIPVGSVETFANNFLCATDDELGGQAVNLKLEGKQPLLAWLQDAPVPDQAAVVKLSTNETDTVNFRSFAALCRKWAGNDATIEVVKDCPLAVTNEISCKLTLCSYGDGRRTVTPAGESGFTVVDGGDVVVSNLVFRGYRGVSGSLFTVDGETAALTLAQGASLRDLDGSDWCSGAVVVYDGTFTMLSGSEIRECDATGRKVGTEAFGGAVTLEGGLFSMEGGQITGCSAALGGGGVYIDEYGLGVMEISGDASVRYNYVGMDDNDIEVWDPAQLVVAGPLTERSGVVTEVPAEDGELVQFATVAEDVSAADAAKAASRLYYDDDPRYVGSLEPSDDRKVVWLRTIVDLTVDPDDPTACVCVNGERYYAGLDDAIAAECQEGAGTLDFVIMGTDAHASIDGWYYDYSGVIRTDAVISGDVTIRGADDNPGSLAVVTRMNNACFKVPVGSSLTLTNIVLDAQDCYLYYDELYLLNDGDQFLYADGGSIALQNEVSVLNVAGYGLGTCGVLVENGGKLTMESGAEIYYCYNLNDSDLLNGFDLGGGVIIANDESSFDMRGGSITDCLSALGGGASLSDKSSIAISGDAVIDWNYIGEWEADENLVLADLSSLCLTDDFWGSIGVTAGYREKNTNVFGTVAADYATNDAQRIQASARCFFRDANPDDLGVAVSGPSGKMLLVWTSALKVDEDGKRYYEVEETDEHGEKLMVRYDEIGDGKIPTLIEPPTAVVGLVYNGNEQTGVVENVGYTLTGNTATNAGTYTAVATLEEDYMWSDRTTAPKEIIWSIAEAPVPPPEPPEWTVVTNSPDLTPLAFKSIERISDTEWRLVITNRVRYCNYRILSTTDLNAGFVNTGDWEHVVNEDCAVWTTNVITTGGAWFWRAEGTEGTNMVPPAVEN